MFNWKNVNQIDVGNILSLTCFFRFHKSISDSSFLFPVYLDISQRKLSRSYLLFIKASCYLIFFSLSAIYSMRKLGLSNPIYSCSSALEEEKKIKSIICIYNSFNFNVFIINISKRRSYNFGYNPFAFYKDIFVIVVIL